MTQYRWNTYLIACFTVVFGVFLCRLWDCSSGCTCSLVFTRLDLQSRLGDKPHKFEVVCPQKGTPVLKEVNIKSALGDACIELHYTRLWKPQNIQGLPLLQHAANRQHTGSALHRRTAPSAPIAETLCTYCLARMRNSFQFVHSFYHETSVTTGVQIQSTTCS